MEEKKLDLMSLKLWFIKKVSSFYIDFEWKNDELLH